MLRTELKTFGEPPGPITKTTKHLYIKRLIKHQRKSLFSNSPDEKPETSQLSKLFKIVLNIADSI